MGEWTRLAVRIAVPDRDRFAELLWELGTIGFQEHSLQGNYLQLDAYFDRQTPATDLAHRFREAVAVQGLKWDKKLELAGVSQQPEDWLRKWKEGFTGFPLGSKAWVHPPWEPPNRRRLLNLMIEPGHAFGTGTHESTQLCWEWLEDCLEGAASLLDVGTGSGILSMGSRRLYPQLQVVALDNDPLAAEAAQANIKLNQADGIRLLAGETEALSPALRFDVVVANLTLDIFRHLAADLTRRTGGQLILSGFTQDQTPQVRELFTRTDVFKVHSRHRQGWEALRLSRA